MTSINVEISEIDPDAGWDEQPVDSTYHPCCHAIGGHGRDCGNAGLVTALVGVEPDEWEDHDGRQYRIIHGRKRSLDGNPEFTVAATAVQLGDGTLDRCAVIEAPKVWLTAPERGLTVEQARVLAAALLEVAAEVEGWAGIG